VHGITGHNFETRYLSDDSDQVGFHWSDTFRGEFFFKRLRRTTDEGCQVMAIKAVHQPTWPLLLKIEHMVKLQVLCNISKSVNNIKNLTRSKNDQHSKIYQPCNFEVNLITHLGVVALFSSLMIKGQQLQNGLWDLLQNCRVGRS
jgi:hypothetical protein